MCLCGRMCLYALVCMYAFQLTFFRVTGNLPWLCVYKYTLLISTTGKLPRLELCLYDDFKGAKMQVYIMHKCACMPFCKLIISGILESSLDDEKCVYTKMIRVCLCKDASAFDLCICSFDKSAHQYTWKIFRQMLESFRG